MLLNHTNMTAELHFTEQYGQLGEKNTYLIGSKSNKLGGVRLRGCERSQRKRHAGAWLVDWVRFALLPQGYPESVSSDYMSYQLWDTAQAFCSYLSGTLTTKAIMQGVGVGDAGATPLAATITWVMRDGTGMIGRIFFASWKGPSLDANCKQWRLAADVINDLAMTLELCSPALPDKWFPWALCLATSMKAIVGVAGGATRAALTQHQAQRNNMADVAAKDGSQETLVNLVASMAGIALLPLLTSNFSTWILFLLLSTLHLYANFRAVRSLNIPILNAQRFNLLLQAYAMSGKCIEKPALINNREVVFLGMGLSDRKLCGFELHLGSSMGDVAELSPSSIKLACKLSDQYLVLPSIKRRRISVIFHNSITPPPALRAYFHAMALAVTCNTLLQEAANENEESATVVENAMFTASDHVAYHFSKFENDAREAGWNMDRHQLLVDEWKAQWYFQTNKSQ